mmetsp:Transcript_42766/g.100428  ORF Transcript_42766/g.100428 Transcript_42766/m.100428 type:complete len:87 (+) Transcript_42766:890-1150(+)
MMLVWRFALPLSAESSAKTHDAFFVMTRSRYRHLLPYVPSLNGTVCASAMGVHTDMLRSIPMLAFAPDLQKRDTVKIRSVHFDMFG